MQASKPKVNTVGLQIRIWLSVYKRRVLRTRSAAGHTGVHRPRNGEKAVNKILFDVLMQYTYFCDFIFIAEIEHWQY